MQKKGGNYTPSGQPALSSNDKLEAFKPFISRISKRTFTSSSAIDIDDLIQVGLMAANIAIHSYDAAHGANFKSFVENGIKDAIYAEASMHCGIFFIPPYVMGLAVRVHRLANKGHSDGRISGTLTRDTGRNITPDWVRDLRFLYSRRAVAPYEQAYSHASDSSAPDHDQIIDFFSKLNLTKVETKVFHLRFLHGFNGDETAKQLGLTQGYVSKIQSNLEKKIREVINGRA